MTGTSEGGKKAAKTRGHEELSKAGRKGGEHSHSGSAASTNSESRNRTNRGNDQSSGKSSRDNSDLDDK